MFKKISGTVIHWEKLWRTLWFPTANISCISSDIKDSVFKINIVVDNTVYSWVWSHMLSKKIFEAHIFDFNNNIYGKDIEIILLEELRENKKFSSLEKLISQIKNDVALARSHDISVLTFGSFDVVHAGHQYYLWESRKYGNSLSTIVASDENIQKIKWKAPLLSLEKRVQAVEELWFSDQVIPGSKSNPMKWIEQLKPDIICLWYDQRWPFVEKLEWEIKNVGLTTQIIRIAAFHPETFKSSIIKKKDIL